MVLDLFIFLILFVIFVINSVWVEEEEEVAF